MNFHPSRLAGAFLIEPERLIDERGFFARLWCQRELHAIRLETDIVQSSISFNPSRATLRGLHYQQPPHAETKLIRCTRGAIYDVIVDLRPSSPTRYQWQAFELSAENRLTLYIPKEFAHGFLTLEPDSEVLYQMTEYHHAPAARGLRWDDPLLAIQWPQSPHLISQRDANYPLLEARLPAPAQV